MSVKIGFVLVLVFMALWYKAFGLAADVALALNLVLIIALLSLLQATLTLPGIAGIRAHRGHGGGRQRTYFSAHPRGDHERQLAPGQHSCRL